jgi:hypothetical protein
MSKDFRRIRDFLDWMLELEAIQDDGTWLIPPCTPRPDSAVQVAQALERVFASSASVIVGPYLPPPSGPVGYIRVVN